MAAFRYNFGNRRQCVDCYHERKRREHATDDRPRSRAGRNRRGRFIGKRPHHWALYHFRAYLDRVWCYGPPEAGTYLAACGYRYQESCAICGAEGRLQAYWADYRQPTQFAKLCATHRRIASFGDHRSVEEVNADLTAAREAIARVRADLGRIGVVCRSVMSAGRGAGETNGSR